MLGMAPSAFEAPLLGELEPDDPKLGLGVAVPLADFGPAWPPCMLDVDDESSEDESANDDSKVDGTSEPNDGNGTPVGGLELEAPFEPAEEAAEFAIPGEVLD